MVHSTPQDKASKQYIEKLHHHYKHTDSYSSEPTFRKRYSHEADQNIWP